MSTHYGAKGVQSCSRGRGTDTPSPSSTSQQDQPTTAPTTSPLSRVQASPAKIKKQIDFSKPQVFVTFIVDEDQNKQTFIVHRCLVDCYSSFFKIAFSSAFMEGETQSMTIEDVESSGFGLLVHWLYTQNLKQDYGEDAPDVVLLAKVWALAERFIIPQLQNLSIDHFRLGLDRITELKIFEKLAAFAYGKDMAKDNPIRKLLVEKFCYIPFTATTNISDSATVKRSLQWPGIPSAFPAEFLTDIMKTLAEFHDRQSHKLYGKVSESSIFHVPITGETNSLQS